MYVIKDYSDRDVNGNPKVLIVNDKTDPPNLMEEPNNLWYWLQRQKDHPKETQIAVYVLGNCVLDFS